MATKLTPYLWNRTTSVAKQGKYRISMKAGDPVIEVIIETSDDMRIYPATTGHPELVEMVNNVKRNAGFHDGGQFSINEFRQVVVPATDSLGDGEVKYYLAGEYYRDIILALDGEEFSGRPVDANGQSITPGDSWSGRPRPGICYKLKAGAADIEFLVKISPGREKFYRLSKFVGPANARQTAGKIARIKGHRGGRFFINEYRAMFCPVQERDLTDWKFVGTLEGDDSWFPKWAPTEQATKASPGNQTEPSRQPSIVSPPPKHSPPSPQTDENKNEPERSKTEKGSIPRIEDFLS